MSYEVGIGRVICGCKIIHYYGHRQTQTPFQASAFYAPDQLPVASYQRFRCHRTKNPPFAARHCRCHPQAEPNRLSRGRPRGGAIWKAPFPGKPLITISISGNTMVHGQRSYQNWLKMSELGKNETLLLLPVRSIAKASKKERLLNLIPDLMGGNSSTGASDIWRSIRWVCPWRSSFRQPISMMVRRGLSYYPSLTSVLSDSNWSGATSTMEVISRTVLGSINGKWRPRKGRQVVKALFPKQAVGKLNVHSPGSIFSAD
jgi:hypothetical protein